MTKARSFLMYVLAVLAATLSVATFAYSQNYSALAKFGNRNGTPELPTLGVIAQGRDGNLYSTTYRGGAHQAGAVFRITPGGQLTTLYSFCSKANCVDGAYPYGGLTLGTDGNFYGTTMGGGINLKSCFDNNGCGTIFKITPSGALTVLYRFNNSSDGAFPGAPPIQGIDGNFYGTATAGGATECGTVYKLTTAGAFAPLFAFDETHGCAPYGPLTLGTDGNFYSTTLLGGNTYGNGLPGLGVVFKITSAGKLTVLYNFDGTHGAYPYSPVVQGKNGNFYGTTSVGGFGDCVGAIFQITPSGALTELACLNGTTDGSEIDAGLLQASDGNFYGVAQAGGNNICDGVSCGTLFKLTSSGNDLSVLHTFEDQTGFSPEVTLFQHTNGTIYGIADSGGIIVNGVCASGCGTFYSWNAHLPTFVMSLPNSGKVGTTIGILGQGFDSKTTVSFNGTPAIVTVVSNTYLTAKVPIGAKTGFLTVIASGRTLTSKTRFRVP